MANKKETGLSILGTVIETQTYIANSILGEQRAKTDAIMSWVLRKGVNLVIFSTICVAIAIIKPYIDMLFDTVFENISTHDLYLFHSNILEKSKLHAGRSPIAIFFSWAAVILMYVVLIAADWRVKFNFNAIEDGKSYVKRDLGHIIAWGLFNAASLYIVMSSFAHHEANKFTENNKDKYKTENLKYIHIDSLNDPNVISLKEDKNGIINNKNILELELKAAIENKSIWVKRQGIPKYQNQFGHRGLQNKVNAFSNEIIEIKSDITIENIAINYQDKKVKDKITALHWIDLELANSFKSEIETKRIVGNATGSFFEFVLFILLKLSKKLSNETENKIESSEPRERIAKATSKRISSGAKSISSFATGLIEKVSSFKKNKTSSKKEEPVLKPVANQVQTSFFEEEKKYSSEEKQALINRLKEHKTYGKIHYYLIEMLSSRVIAGSENTVFIDGVLSVTQGQHALSDISGIESPAIKSHYNSYYVKKLLPMLDKTELNLLYSEATNKNR